jgi:hypothetical protein
MALNKSNPETLRLRAVWRAMKARCSNPKNKSYKDYGERGISYDTSWSVFDNFLHDMQPSYREGLTLDRMDNSRGYSVENCRWATHKEQNRNKREHRVLTVGNQKRILAEWIDLSGIKRSTVKQRFYVYGWSIEESLGIVPRSSKALR